uniref:SFRICE_002231 n=1 Tax=Spodoptera frugiperda TaxID=7108 RepID=A0A2H1V402_SPOFR
MAESTDTVFIDVASPSQFALVDTAMTDTTMTNITLNDTTDQPKLDAETVDPDNPSLVVLTAQPRRIRCPECDRYTAETEEKMLRHIRKKHRGENPFQCYMCDYSTYNKVLFEEHVRIHQGIKPYKCSHCPYRSVSKKNTKKHELIHRPDNPHKCEQCGFIARHVRALRHHVLSHSTETTVEECSMCLMKFNSEQKYNSHRRSRKRCPECKKMFCSRIYQDHLSSIHGVQKTAKKQNSKKAASFKCAICGWEASSKPRILLHLIHHPDQEVDESVVDTLILRELGIMSEHKSSD